MKTKRNAPAAPEPGAIYIRNTAALQALRAVPRLRALAAAAGASEAQIARAALALGLAQAEADPGALAQAFNEN